MLVSKIMTRNVESVAPDDSLQVAARKMRDLDVGPMPVCDSGRVAGMLTDRDITVRATAEGLDPRTTPVRTVMTEEVVFCFDDQDSRDAARTMEEQQIRRILVLDRDKRLVGIVSLGDLATETGDTLRVGEVVQNVSEPATVRP